MASDKERPAIYPLRFHRGSTMKSEMPSNTKRRASE